MIRLAKPSDRVRAAARLANGSRRAASGCLLWTRATYPNGYGQMWFDGRNQPAHRVAWQVRHGPIPNGLQVLHRCDTPLCIDTDHHFLGTQAANMADMSQKGRAPCRSGEACWNAKLSADAVRHIRTASASPAELATAFGVSRSTIYSVRRGVGWRDVA